MSRVPNRSHFTPSSSPMAMTYSPNDYAGAVLQPQPGQQGRSFEGNFETPGFGTGNHPTGGHCGSFNFFGPVHIHTFNNNLYTNDVGVQVRSSSQLTQAHPLDHGLISPVGQPTTPSFQPTPAIPTTPSKALPHSRVTLRKKAPKSVPAPATTSGNGNGSIAHYSD